MVTKVHAGLYSDSSQSASIRCYIIGITGVEDAVAASDNLVYGLPDGTAFTYNKGDAVPNTKADIAIRLLQSRCTPIAINIIDDEIHVIVENNVNGWGYSTASGAADLQAALKAIGSVTVSMPAAAAAYDFAGATATECVMTFAGTAPVDAAGGTVGGLGGNENDQLFGGATTAP